MKNKISLLVGILIILMGVYAVFQVDDKTDTNSSDFSVQGLESGKTYQNTQEGGNTGSTTGGGTADDGCDERGGLYNSRSECSFETECDSCDLKGGCYVCETNPGGANDSGGDTGDGGSGSGNAGDDGGGDTGGDDGSSGGSVGQSSTCEDVDGIVYEKRKECKDSCKSLGGTCEKVEGGANFDNDRLCHCPWCGNGIIENGEECDDGENNGVFPDAGEYCNQFCEKSFIIDVPHQEPGCGNGIIEIDLGEECDRGILNGTPRTKAGLGYDHEGYINLPRYTYCSETCEILYEYSCPGGGQECTSSNDCSFDIDPFSGIPGTDDLFLSDSTVCKSNVCTCIDSREIGGPFTTSPQESEPEPTPKYCTQLEGEECIKDLQCGIDGVCEGGVCECEGDQDGDMK